MTIELFIYAPISQHYNNLGYYPPLIARFLKKTFSKYLQRHIKNMLQWKMSNYVYFLSTLDHENTFNLINYSKKSNKNWKTWTYGVYLWQNDTHCKVWKIAYVFQNQGCGWNPWVNFFMVYDIDIHQLNLGTFKILKILDAIPF